MSEIQMIVGERNGASLRKILVWKRLEPGVSRGNETLSVPESPHLEAKAIAIGVGARELAEMERLSKSRDSALAFAQSWALRYEPGGMLLTVGLGAAIGAYLAFLRPAELFWYAGLATAAVGLVVIVAAKYAVVRAQRLGHERWGSSPERKEYDDLARELAQAWFEFSERVRADGFHTEIRVGEGSGDPIRLASVDPSLLASTRTFDPEDWKPTVGGGVRYEEVHNNGMIETRVLASQAEIEPEVETKRDDANA